MIKKFVYFIGVSVVFFVGVFIGYAQDSKIDYPITSYLNNYFVNDVLTIVPLDSTLLTESKPSSDSAYDNGSDIPVTDPNAGYDNESDVPVTDSNAGYDSGSDIPVTDSDGSSENGVDVPVTDTGFIDSYVPIDDGEFDTDYGYVDPYVPVINDVKPDDSVVDDGGRVDVKDPVVIPSGRIDVGKEDKEEVKEDKEPEVKVVEKIVEKVVVVHDKPKSFLPDVIHNQGMVIIFLLAGLAFSGFVWWFIGWSVNLGQGRHEGRRSGRIYRSFVRDHKVDEMEKVYVPLLDLFNGDVKGKEFVDEFKRFNADIELFGSEETKEVSREFLRFVSNGDFDVDGDEFLKLKNSLVNGIKLDLGV